MALSNNTKGALLMVLSMAGFTMNDTLTKAVTPWMNIGQIMLLRGIMTSLLVYFIARRMGALSNFKVVFQPMVLLRVGLESAAALSFLTALGPLSLGNISSIMQSLPLAVTLGAAIFLREPVGWRRWTAIVIGFIGVLIILRPGPEGFTPAAGFALLAVFCAAGRDLATKRIPAGVSSLTVTMLTTMGTAVLGAILLVPMGGWTPVSPTVFAMIALASALIFVGHQCIVIAMRTSEISFIAPFRYTSLLWAVALGMLFFGEQLDPYMIAGTVIIIGSGLYTFSRENKRKISPLRGQESQPGSPL